MSLFARQYGNGEMGRLSPIFTFRSGIDVPLADTGRQCGLQYFAEGRNVVIGNPLAEFEKVWTNQGFAIDNTFDREHLNTWRGFFPQADHETIGLPFSKWN